MRGATTELGSGAASGCVDNSGSAGARRKGEGSGSLCCAGFTKTEEDEDDPERAIGSEAGSLRSGFTGATP
jgi:hypothetical protein